MNRLLKRGVVSVALLSAVAVAGCTTRVVTGSGAASVAATLSVERFLQAANDRDFQTMSRIFGTADGPIGDTGSTLGCAFKKIGSWFGGQPCVKRTEVEIRMDTIARILQHEDYRIGGEETVAGREHPTRRVFVTLVVSGETISDVPFVVVRTSDGRWMVQEVDLERVTSPRE